MQFANSGFLWALSLLTVPIIIHLFKFRKYKQVYFPNIKFLKKLSEEQQSKRRLKDILILLSRLIVLAGLIIAFAQPYLGKKGQLAMGNAISVYIDNSFSMENETEQGVLIDQARKKAEELAMAYQPTDRFNLITNDLDAKHQRWVDRKAFLEFVYETELSPRVVKLSDIELRQQDMLQKNEGYKQWVYMISDFQKTTADFENISADNKNALRLIPLKASNIQNLFIDSVWFNTPIRQTGVLETLNFRIVNQSDKNLDEVPVRFEINGQLKAMANISVKAFSKNDTLMHFTANDKEGYQNARITLNDHPIVFDDDYYFSYELRNHIRITELYENEDSKDNFAVLFNDSLYDFNRVSVKQIDFSALGESDLIILNGLVQISSGLSSFIQNWIKAGGNLLLTPAAMIIENDYNTFLSKYGAKFVLPIDTNTVRVSEIEMRDALYTGVFKDLPTGHSLPELKQHYLITWNTLDYQKLMMLPGNDFLLARRPFEKGNIYLFTVPLDREWSNLARHALFVTTALRIAEQSVHTPLIEHKISDDSRLVIPLTKINTQESKPFELRADDGSMAFMPAQQWMNGKLYIQTGTEIKNAGFYKLIRSDSSFASLAYNFSREESMMEFFTPEVISDWSNNKENVGVLNVQNKTIKPNMVRDEKPLWKFFILTALIFLVFEIVIIKVMKS